MREFKLNKREREGEITTTTNYYISENREEHRSSPSNDDDKKYFDKRASVYCLYNNVALQSSLVELTNG